MVFERQKRFSVFFRCLRGCPLPRSPTPPTPAKTDISKRLCCRGRGLFDAFCLLHLLAAREKGAQLITSDRCDVVRFQHSTSRHGGTPRLESKLSFFVFVYKRQRYVCVLPANNQFQGEYCCIHTNSLRVFLCSTPITCYRVRSPASRVDCVVCAPAQVQLRNESDRQMGAQGASSISTTHPRG